MIETILFRIAESIIARLLSEAIPITKSIINVYSVFSHVNDYYNAINSENYCKQFFAKSIEYLFTNLSDVCIEEVMRIGDLDYEIRKTESGIFIAGNKINSITTNRISFPSMNKMEFPTFEKKHFY